MQILKIQSKKYTIISKIKINCGKAYLRKQMESRKIHLRVVFNKKQSKIAKCIHKQRLWKGIGTCCPLKCSKL